jgi:anionic cell wall polymer biosynthesis LytR-Cps2A-Psr (LCP) family protein
LPRLRRPRLPSRRSLRLGASAVVGAMAAAWLLGLAWPLKDRSSAPRQEITPATLAEKPRRPITVLLIGIDSDRIGAGVNGAAPAGPANSDALMLLRVNPQGPLQVLTLPTELAINLPGEKKPVALGSLYRKGGVALVADAVRELIGMEDPKPDRYLVLSRGAMRDLINGLDGLELNPPRKMKYEDKSLKYRIDLLPGLQQMGGRCCASVTAGWARPDVAPTIRWCRRPCGRGWPGPSSWPGCPTCWPACVTRSTPIWARARRSA